MTPLEEARQFVEAEKRHGSVYPSPGLVAALVAEIEQLVAALLVESEAADCEKCLLQFADADDDVSSHLAVELMEAREEIERLREEAKHATELADSALAGERQEIERLRAALDLSEEYNGQKDAEIERLRAIPAAIERLIKEQQEADPDTPMPWFVGATTVLRAVERILEDGHASE